MGHVFTAVLLLAIGIIAIHIKVICVELKIDKHLEEHKNASR